MYVLYFVLFLIGQAREFFIIRLTLNSLINFVKKCQLGKRDEKDANAIKVTNAICYLLITENLNSMVLQKREEITL